MRLNDKQMRFLDDAFVLWTERHANTPDYFKVRKHFTFAKIQLSDELPLEPASSEAVETLLHEVLQNTEPSKDDLKTIFEIASALSLEAVRKSVDIHIV